MFEDFLAANNIPDDRKDNLFLATIGPEAYKLLTNLCDPANPSCKTYADLNSVLLNHYEPAPIVTAERHKFWTLSQGTDGSVADFIVWLKKLSSFCSFGLFLEEVLRNRLVFGLHPKMIKVQKQLPTIRDLKFIDV